MEDVELSVPAEETPAAAQHDNQRNLLRRLQPEGSERHLVAERPKSDCWCISAKEATFNLHLRAMFIIMLASTVITVLYGQYFRRSSPRPVLISYHPYPYPRTQLYEQPQIKWTVFLFVAKLVAVLTVGVLMRKTRTKTRSRPKGKEEKCTIFVVQQV